MEDKIKDGFYQVRNCSLCEEGIGYIIQDGKCFFDAHCGCVKYRMRPPEPRPLEEFKEFMESQKGEEHAR